MWRINAEKASLLLRSRTATCGPTIHVRFLPSFCDSPFFVSLVRFSARLAPFKRNERTNDVVEASEDFAAKEGRRSERRAREGKGVRKQVPKTSPTFHLEEGRVEPPRTSS